MWTSQEFVSSVILLFILLNPFLIIVYIIDIVQDTKAKEFIRILVRAGFISAIVFTVFAATKDFVFKEIIQVEFASFQIFGGIIFLLIGVQFVFKGVNAVTKLRGNPKQVVGSLAMPIMIGPGSISASIVIGERLSLGAAVIAILIAVFMSMLIMIILKLLHDSISATKEELIERYFEITGRITALVVGAFAIEMIMKGIKSYLENA